MSVIPYAEYHAKSLKIGDVDPSYEMLLYVCDRFELSIEQRYWLAFLYSTCYCGPTVFYMYNEFPDFEMVDVGRLERWWKSNKSRLLFQTDRRWIRSNDQFVEMFVSYRNLLGHFNQEKFFANLRPPKRPDSQVAPYIHYEAAYMACHQIKQMGRFSLFLYLEAVAVVTGLKILPRSMPINSAEACKRGLEYAIWGKETGDKSPEYKRWLQKKFDELVQELSRDGISNVWKIETTLCAYGKYRLAKRYIGYYLDRQGAEIARMQEQAPEGVDWSVLWDYRKETYDHQYLVELNP